MRIGLRELRRAKGRFALLSGAVGLLVLLLLFFQTTAGTLVRALTGAVEGADADVLVYDDRARSNPLASVLPAEAAEAVAAVDGVTDAAPLSVAVVTAAVGGTEVEVALVGIEPGAPGTPRTVDGPLPGAGEVLASGSGFDPGPAPGTTVTVGGERLAVVSTAEAAFSALPTLYLDRETYAAALADRLPPGAPTPVSAVAVHGDGDPTALAERIAAALPDLEALAQADAVAALPGVGTIGRSFGVLYLLLYLVVTIVTGVFFLILTVQKRDALVLLRAVGAEPRDLVTLVLGQVVAVVGVGVLVGAGLAGGLLALTRDVLGGSLSATTTARSALLVLGLAMLATAGAIRRVLAIEPVEATRAGALG